MYSSGVKSMGSSSVRCWWYCPMRRWLWRFTMPSSGSRSPVISLSSVDLPALGKQGGEKDNVKYRGRKKKKGWHPKPQRVSESAANPLPSAMKDLKLRIQGPNSPGLTITACLLHWGPPPPHVSQGPPPGQRVSRGPCPSSSQRSHLRTAALVGEAFPPSQSGT